jgi:hypothetical protein
LLLFTRLYRDARSKKQEKKLEISVFHVVFLDTQLSSITGQDSTGAYSVFNYVKGYKMSIAFKPPINCKLTGKFVLCFNITANHEGRWRNGSTSFIPHVFGFDT